MDSKIDAVSNDLRTGADQGVNAAGGDKKAGKPFLTKNTGVNHGGNPHGNNRHTQGFNA